MKRTFLAFASATALAGLVPATALASHEQVGVEVRVVGGSGWDDDVAWIEFRPDQDAWVALYAVFSDGSVELVFPTWPGESHWVDSCHPYEAGIAIPRGAHLEQVQAIASRRWFDPSESWIATGPDCDWTEPRVIVAASWPTWWWGFSFAWSQPSYCWTTVHRAWWSPPPWDGRVGRYHEHWRRVPMDRREDGPSFAPRDRVRRGEDGQRQYAAGKGSGAREGGKKQGVAQKRSVTTGRDGAANPSEVRWAPGGRSKAKAQAAPGQKTSAPRRDSGEPERRSGR